MRPGPATQAAFVRGFLTRRCHRWAVERSLQPDSARKECRICQSQLRISDRTNQDLSIQDRAITLRNRCGGQRPCPAPKSKGGGGRNARATSSRFRAQFWSPPAIHPRESPAAASSSAIIQQAQELSRFAEPTFIQIVAPRNTKTCSPCAETVEDETSLWKHEEN